jgi:hypothetical protein
VSGAGAEAIPGTPWRRLCFASHIRSWASWANLAALFGLLPKFFLLQAKKILHSLNFGSISPSVAPQKRSNKTSNKPKSNIVKTLFKWAIIGLALAGVVQAQSTTVTQNSTQNVTINDTSFTFNQFNPSLGTLSAVDLILNSSVPGGSIGATNQTGANMTITDFEIRLRLNADSNLGIVAYNASNPSINTSPDWRVTTIPANSSSTFSVLGGQSLLSSPVTIPVSNSSWVQYIGLGTITFTAKIQNLITATAATFAVDSTNTSANTSFSLRYTYTASVNPVPEPGQVAASLLLLGGIGGYVFIKRRRKSTVAAA